MTNMVKPGLRVQLEALVELTQYYFSSLSLSPLSRKKESSMTATFFQRDYIYIHSSSLA